MDSSKAKNLSEGLKGFLSWLPEEDVLSILKTTSGGLIFAANKDDAISTIVRYSDAVSVLNRKKIRKDVLVSYLHHHNVSFKLPTDKTTLCRICLTQWGHENVHSYQFHDSASKTDEEAKNGSSLLSRRMQESNRNISELKFETSLTSNRASTSRSFSPTQTPSNSPNPHVEDDTIQIVPLRTSQDDNMEVEYNYQQELRKQELQLGQELAVTFTKWFFEKWNNLDDFVDKHFWPECNLRLEIINGSSMPFCKEILLNGTQCCEEMRNLIETEGLLFNPNVENGLGVRGKINPHGLAQVVVCGSVHRKHDSAVLGIFEQVFGLMKDPLAENRYKLKFTVLRFRAGGSICNSRLPTLCDSTLIGVLEEED